MIIVLVASSAEYKLYNYSFHPLKLELVKLQENVGMREQRGKFISIHENSEQTHHGSHATAHHSKEVSIDNFAQLIAKEINYEVDQAKAQNLEYKIITLAGPHMNGLLNKHFSDDTKARIKLNFQKDLMHLEQNKLLEYLQEHKFG